MDSSRELVEIVQGLRTGTAPGTPLRKKKAKPASYLDHKALLRVQRRQRILFRVAVAMIVLGVLAIPLSSLWTTPEVQAEVESTPPAPPLPPAEVAVIHTQSRILESKYPRLKDQPRKEAEVNHDVGRKRLLARLSVEGKPPHFVPTSDLRLPSDGKPLKVYCFLRTPLDEFTEKHWREVGILRDEAEIIDPYLRYVVVGDEDSLRLLSCAAVESATLSLYPNAEPPIQQ
ncbi:MAG TPA: hypothetical protein VGP72_10585 [Planctomycetota bacterium]